MEPAATPATKSFNAPETKLHFLDYWRIIRVRKTVILAVFLLVAITTTLVTFILPPAYASMVRISVQKDASDIPGVTYKLLKRQVDVTQSRNTTLIEIKVLSDDAQDASVIANRIAEAYKQT